MAEISKQAAAGVLIFGIVLIFIGFSISPTRTVESCYQGTYTQGCAQTTVPNPFPRGLLIIAGLVSVIGGLGMFGKATNGGNKSTPQKSGATRARELFADQSKKSGATKAKELLADQIEEDQAKGGHYESNETEDGEMFCWSCGESIRQNMESCPHCGARTHTNTSRQQRDLRAVTSSASSSAIEYLISLDEDATEVAKKTDNWYFGVAAGAVCWHLYWMFGIIANIDSLGALFFLVALFGTPTATYMDRKYIRSSTEWTPRVVLWAFTTAVLPGIVGPIYIYQRYKKLGKPELDSVADSVEEALLSRR